MGEDPASGRITSLVEIQSKIVSYLAEIGTHGPQMAIGVNGHRSIKLGLEIHMVVHKTETYLTNSETS